MSGKRVEHAHDANILYPNGSTPENDHDNCTTLTDFCMYIPAGGVKPSDGDKEPNDLL